MKRTVVDGVCLEERERGWKEGREPRKEVLWRVWGRRKEREEKQEMAFFFEFEVEAGMRARVRVEADAILFFSFFFFLLSPLLFLVFLSLLC